MITQLTVPPTTRVHETYFPGINGKRLNDRMRVIINYQVIEKTKSYTVLRLNYIHEVPVVGGLNAQLRRLKN